MRHPSRCQRLADSRRPGEENASSRYQPRSCEALFMLALRYDLGNFCVDGVIPDGCAAKKNRKLLTNELETGIEVNGS